MYKSGDYVFHKNSGLVKKIKRKGKGMYAGAWLTDQGYVWSSGIRPATPAEVEEAQSQTVTVLIMDY